MAAIIFDMDGTIADSFDYVADFLAKEAGLPPLSDEQKQSLRGLSVNGMVERMGFHWWHAPLLFFKGRHQMRHAMRHLKAFKGMPNTIRKLHAEGHELFILSTNSLNNIHHFLHDQKIHTYFLEIYGGVGIFNKAPALRQLLREQNIEVAQAVYVGDERRDVEAAQAIGLRAIAVSWGFAYRGGLKKLKPTGLADTPDQLMKILEEL
jgi:phosphoglycolate phosphatase